DALQLGHFLAVVKRLAFLQEFVFRRHKIKTGNHRWTQMDTDTDVMPEASRIRASSFWPRVQSTTGESECANSLRNSVPHLCSSVSICGFDSSSHNPLKFQLWMFEIEDQTDAKSGNLQIIDHLAALYISDAINGIAIYNHLIE